MKKYLSIFLICILVVSNITMSFASTNTKKENIDNVENIWEITGIEYEIEVTEEETIEHGSYEYNGNKVTYTRTVKQDGTIEFIFNEGDSTDIYLYDNIQNQLYKNRELLDMKIELVEVRNIDEDKIEGMNDIAVTSEGYVWRYVTSYSGSTRFQITTTTAVAVALSAALGGPVGIFLATAAVFVTDYANEYLLVYYNKTKYEAVNPGIYPYVWRFEAEFFEDRSHRYPIEDTETEWLEFAVLPRYM